ncbi:IQ domain-containing protein H isoform X3 [Cyanistes caeruleus]|uniref:IQ domain-containing protein H isoform X3 n=1 Tax=Cyanistes caeruleus TaxID=156563 RepID=UPI000CDAF98D|nr:IQ domain-containing protein H isoform X3 [Cyanistes caeruleus]
MCYLENPSCIPTQESFQRLKGAPRPGEPTLHQLQTGFVLGDSCRVQQHECLLVPLQWQDTELSNQEDFNVTQSEDTQTGLQFSYSEQWKLRHFKIQDLQKLKMEKNNLKGNAEAMDICDLRKATERTELGLRKHAENYINVVNGQELTLSSAGNKEENSKEPPKWSLPFGACQKQLVLPRVEPVTVQRCSRSAPRVSQGSQQQVEIDFKIMLDPENTDNKAGLKHPNDETRLPLITKKKSAPMCSQKPGKGPTASSPWALPAFHSPGFPLPLTEEDTPKGGQRLILPAAERTLPAPPVVSRAAPFPEFPRQHKKSAVGEISSRLDPENTDTITFPKPKEVINGTSSSAKGNIAPLPSSNSMVSTRKSKPEWRYPAQQLESEVHIPSLTQPPQTAQPLQDPCLDWDSAVQQKALGFLALQDHHHSSWGSIVGFLEPTEKLLKDHTVPLATIHGQKLAQTASDLNFKENPTKSEVLSVMKNQSAVEKILSRAGQSCRGQGGSAGAAAEIQRRRLGAEPGSTQQQQRAAGVISASWRSWNHLARVRNALREARHRHLENFYSRAKHLAANWNRIRTSRRTIIHIPSLGYSQHIREHIPDLALQQNLQMGRLCDILDANVDVIYICPLALSEELVQYYHKLLGLQAAVRSGNPEDMADLQDRFRILTPEAINSFPEHHMCLATVLKYSPRTMQRLQVLLQGRDAYLVGGVPHLDDLVVADELQVPILGSEPAVAQLYSTKSGSKRIFASAGVPTPPGEQDIHSREQLLRALSQLILDNLEVQRWLFKVDDERGGNGTAFCDVISHLECYPWIQREWQGHGPEAWSESQARELALVKISQELPGLLAQHVQPVNEKRFPTWEKFLQTFLTQGGVIEAFPFSASVANLTVDLLIEPTGEVTLLSSGDQLHAEGPLRSSGTTIPQRSVDPEVLGVLCLKIGEACKSKGVLGYFSVDFVAFTHPQTREQQVWATDLDLCYSDQLALTRLLLYLTDGNLDCGLQGPLGSKESKSQQLQHEGTKPPAPSSPRCAVASSQLRHSSLSGISYNLLLHTCKARGVGFDLQEKQGTVFVLYEDQKRHSLGMITIGEDLQGVLLTFARNLFIIHQEISAPNMQGETNFKMAIRDIEAILGVTAENKLGLEEEKPREADALKE